MSKFTPVIVDFLTSWKTDVALAIKTISKWSDGFGRKHPNEATP